MYSIEQLQYAPCWQQGTAELQCVERIDETHAGGQVSAATFIFQARVPARFNYQPGQFLLLSVPIDGTLHPRAYSLSSSPSRPYSLAITVQRVENGLVSNWLLDHCLPGQVLSAEAPTGDFHLSTQQLPKRVLLLSAGSGIAPMLSISRWLLDTGQPVEIAFVHSARSEEALLFRDELQALAARHAHFQLSLILETPGQLPCHAGRLTPPLFMKLMGNLAQSQIYLCGPEGYMAQVEGWLRFMHLAPGQLRKESYAPQALGGDADARYRLSVPELEHEGEIAGHQSLLDALQSQGLPIMGACRNGHCGACRCKVVAGEVKSHTHGFLPASMVEAGYVLACVSQAKSDVEIQLGV